MYKGDGTKQFATEIAAANAISRGSVRDVDIVILHSYPKCFIVSYESGNTGITHIDSAHVNTGRISIDELCKLFDATSSTVGYEISEEEMYLVLSLWWKENDSYKNVIQRQLSEKTVNKIIAG